MNAEPRSARPAPLDGAASSVDSPVGSPALPAAASPALPELQLINRYHAAWLEHGTRVTQRQHVVQMYLTAVAVVFGFYFHADSKDVALCIFLIAGVTLMTGFTSLQLWLHNRALQHLGTFLYRCEQAAAASIREQARDGASLFYFSSPDGSGVDPFHGRQRSAHRAVHAAILIAANGAAGTLGCIELRRLGQSSVAWGAAAFVALCTLPATLLLFKGQQKDQIEG